MAKRKPQLSSPRKASISGYDDVLDGVVGLLEQARRTSARAVNALMTATYWAIGRRIVEFEQGGEQRAGYGRKLLERLAVDLSARFGRGFGYVNLTQMRRFYVAWPECQILQTLSEESQIAQTPSAQLTENALPGISQSASGKSRKKRQTASDEFKTRNAISLESIGARFQLPWSHYVQLLKVENDNARCFYEAEALRCGWTVRQLDRLENKVLAAEYRTALPAEALLVAELERTRRILEARRSRR